MQKARGHRTSLLPPLVGTRFQVLFHSPSGYFSSFPHGTGPLSVTKEYLALEGGPPSFSPRFTGADLLRDIRRKAVQFRLRDGCPLRCAVPRASTTTRLCNFRRAGHGSERTPYNPRQTTRVRLHLPGLG